MEAFASYASQFDFRPADRPLICNVSGDLLSADQLLDSRDKSSSWAAALDNMNLDTLELGAAFNRAREEGDADAMARALADPVLGRSFNAGKPTLLRFRRRGADIAESVLSLYLAGKLKRTPDDILNEIRKGKQTWGSLLNSLGVRIDTVGSLIAEAVKNSERKITVIRDP